MGLIPTGTYDKNFVLQTSATKSETKIKGCEDIYKTSPNGQPDFLKQLICIGYKTRTVLSQTYKVANVPENFESIIKYTNTEKKLNYKLDGYQHDIDDTDITFDYIMISKEDGKKGRIFIVNGNPVSNIYYFENVRNMILYSMSRSIMCIMILANSGSNWAPLPLTSSSLTMCCGIASR